jgi:hypothetical protein
MQSQLDSTAVEYQTADEIQFDGVIRSTRFPARHLNAIRVFAVQLPASVVSLAVVVAASALAVARWGVEGAATAPLAGAGVDAAKCVVMAVTRVLPTLHRGYTLVPCLDED